MALSTPQFSIVSPTLGIIFNYTLKKNLIIKTSHFNKQPKTATATTYEYSA